MADRALLKYLEQFISPKRLARFKSVLEDRTRLITVVTEDVFQLHNTSAVIRSCDVFGIQDLHMIEAQFGSRLDKNIAMGAQQWISVTAHNTTRDCIDHLRRNGYQIVATTPDHPQACALENFEIKDKTALFFGTERDGLTQEVTEEADKFLKIPMVGFTQSLNISVAVAIILHHLSVRLRQSTLPWQLSSEEKESLLLEWAKLSIKSIDEILERYDGEA